MHTQDGLEVEILDLEDDQVGFGFWLLVTS